ncbi:hypothetical protein NM208_g10 [Fusarium decemcellulare]|uniref:Uncharacterized protein n=1 Tax=Fusarium decemcellulare TaxID=57161 RepID=A0ACC1T136_9HYPO|nr:hypothetical protein NM208_g10 [Fusarium decemcellulare]
MSSAPPHEKQRNTSPKPLRRQRLKVSNACQACRLRKVKCDGGHPVCARCQARKKVCTYGGDTITGGQRAKRRLQVAHARPIRPSSELSPALGPHVLQTPSTLATGTPLTSVTESPLVLAPSSAEEQLDQGQEESGQDQESPYYAAHGRFASQVEAAIDVRAGLTPATASNLVPFVDAPLFGDIDLDSASYSNNHAAGLPPRAYADRLVGIYWQCVHPVEPLLDRARFFRDYEMSYSDAGAPPPGDRSIWFSMLNAIFALAVQRQESIPLQKRDEEGNRFFKRAWALVRPETILWKPGSLELVQCLMLLNRYLHCTNNRHKTWMTAGLTVRIAQSMCCHIPQAASAKDASSDARLKQKVWASCVALDRCVSWSLGRTSAPVLIFSPNRASIISSGDPHNLIDDEHRTRELELYEIGNQIQLAQTQCLATKLGLPRLYQHQEYHNMAVELDTCLNRWENNLPNDWKLQNLQDVVDRASRAERYVLHLRPMLAHLYSAKSHTATVPTPNLSSLGDRLVKECARMCIEAAQKITSLIIETLEPYELMGVLPWWYRIFFLHIAGTIFLAAMFRSDLYSESVSQSWHSMLSALRSHEHLSAYVQQCIQTFESLSTRILGTVNSHTESNGGTMLGEGASGSFDDVFQDIGIDFDSFLFGMEDTTAGQC